MAEETKTDVAATEEPAKDAKQAKKGKKKWPIVVGVVAVVLVAAGAGFFRLARAAQLLATPSAIRRWMHTSRPTSTAARISTATS